MKNKKTLFAVIAVLVMLFAFGACGSGDSESEGSDDATTTTQAITDPTVGTDVDGRPIDDQSFYGKWIADSGKAVNMFDGFEITFNEDGTYKAVVTGEEVTGTWSRNGEQVTLVDEDGILPCDYVYTPKGGLKMYYEGEHVGFHR